MLLFIAVFGVVVLAVAVAAIVGLMLPSEYDAAAQIEVPGQPQRVLAALDNVDRYGSWLPAVRAIRELGPGRWHEVRVGAGASVQRTRKNDEIIDRLDIEGEVVVRTWRVAAVGSGTRVELRVQRHVANVFARFANRFVRVPSHAEIQALEGLCRHLGDRQKAAAISWS